MTAIPLQPILPFDNLRRRLSANVMTAVERAERLQPAWNGHSIAAQAVVQPSYLERETSVDHGQTCAALRLALSFN